MIKPRIGGHPVHMMLVHFPSALYPMSVVCSSHFYFWGNSIAGHVAFYTMAGGVVTGWLAIVFGLWESFFISPGSPGTRSRVITTVFWHATLNGMVTILFTVWTLRDWKQYPAIDKDSGWVVLLKWIAILLLIAGNYLGGKLLLKHHIGISKTGIDDSPSKLFNHLDR